LKHLNDQSFMNHRRLNEVCMRRYISWLHAHSIDREDVEIAVKELGSIGPDRSTESIPRRQRSRGHGTSYVNSSLCTATFGRNSRGIVHPDHAVHMEMDWVQLFQCPPSSRAICCCCCHRCCCCGCGCDRVWSRVIHKQLLSKNGHGGLESPKSAELSTTY